METAAKFTFFYFFFFSFAYYFTRKAHLNFAESQCSER